MHDIRFIRENPNIFDENLNKRGVSSCSKEILKLDNEKRKLQTLIQEKQKLRNDVSKKIAEIKSKGESADTLFSKVSDGNLLTLPTIRFKPLKRPNSEL